MNRQSMFLFVKLILKKLFVKVLKKRRGDILSYRIILSYVRGLCHHLETA